MNRQSMPNGRRILVIEGFDPEATGIVSILQRGSPNDRIETIDTLRHAKSMIKKAFRDQDPYRTITCGTHTADSNQAVLELMRFMYAQPLPEGISHHIVAVYSRMWINNEFFQDPKSTKAFRDLVEQTKDRLITLIFSKESGHGKLVDAIGSMAA